MPKAFITTISLLLSVSICVSPLRGEWTAGAPSHHVPPPSEALASAAVFQRGSFQYSLTALILDVGGQRLIEYWQSPAGMDFGLYQFLFTVTVGASASFAAQWIYRQIQSRQLKKMILGGTEPPSLPIDGYFELPSFAFLLGWLAEFKGDRITLAGSAELDRLAIEFVHHDWNRFHPFQWIIVAQWLEWSIATKILEPSTQTNAHQLAVRQALLSELARKIARWKGQQTLSFDPEIVLTKLPELHDFWDRIIRRYEHRNKVTFGVYELGDHDVRLELVGTSRKRVAKKAPMYLEGALTNYVRLPALHVRDEETGEEKIILVYRAYLPNDLRALMPKHPQTDEGDDEAGGSGFAGTIGLFIALTASILAAGNAPSPAGANRTSSPAPVRADLLASA
jgi:hypothetical protein